MGFRHLQKPVSEINVAQPSPPGSAPLRSTPPPARRSATGSPEPGTDGLTFNHVLYVAAVCQIRHDTPAAGTTGASSPQERPRWRPCAAYAGDWDVVYRQLVAEAVTAIQDGYDWAGPGGHSGATLTYSAAGPSPHSRLFGQAADVASAGAKANASTTGRRTGCCWCATVRVGRQCAGCVCDPLRAIDQAADVRALRLLP
jgi:hypothetical protein